VLDHILAQAEARNLLESIQPQCGYVTDPGVHKRNIFGVKRFVIQQICTSLSQ
jgi:hypothetical protein